MVRSGWRSTQYTYFQQVGGLWTSSPVSGELTYGLERLAMYVQGVDSIYDLAFNDPQGPDFMTYGEVFLESEREFSAFDFKPPTSACSNATSRTWSARCRACLSLQGAAGSGARAAGL